jgi:hypothetical protein
MKATQATGKLQAQSKAPSPVPATTRVRGVVVMVIGAGLALGMAYALLSETRGFLNLGVSVGGSTFKGTAQMGYIAIAIMALLAFTGSMFFVGGLQLYRLGRFSKWVGGVLGGLVALLLFAVSRRSLLT